MSSRRAPPTLRARLAEAEATLEAIRTGGVDALVVSGPRGARTLAIEGAMKPYEVLLDAMSDGAALKGPDGRIIFANRRLTELTGITIEQIRGMRFVELIAESGRQAFDGFRAGKGPRAIVGEFVLMRRRGEGIPVSIALSTLPADHRAGPDDPELVMAIVADLTERRQAEATRQELMQRLISVEDEERRRIARELHDETGQSLTALLVGLRAIEERTQTPGVAADARRLRSIAAQTVDNVGRLARGLHPSVLDDLGLLAAIRRYVSDYTKSFGLPVEFTSEGIVDTPLPAIVQTTVYRIVQEALTNVARHAAARAVRLTLRLDGRFLEVVVSDDGRGFDSVNVLAQAEGLGLHGMGERVVLLGGTLSIRSTPGAGATIRAWMPLEPSKGTV